MLKLNNYLTNNFYNILESSRANSVLNQIWTIARKTRGRFDLSNQGHGDSNISYSKRQM